jgi:hypothetical protein
MTDENTQPNANGLFLGQAQIATELKGFLRYHLAVRKKQLAADQMEVLDIVMGSIASAINGDADSPAIWANISGAANVVVERLQGTGQYAELAKQLREHRETNEAKDTTDGQEVKNG